MSQRRRVKIASGCKTEDQFVTVFNRFCDGESIFIATRTPKPVGEILHFCVTLADGKALLAGTGSVSESYVDKSGPFSRPGMRIIFSELDDSSTPILTRLTEAKAKAKPKPAKRPSKPEKATVLGVPPIMPASMPAVAVAETSADDPPPLRDSGTKKTFGLPPPVVEPPTRPERPERAASVDEAWDDQTTNVKTPTPAPLPRARTPRALGSENESSDETPESRLRKLDDVDRTPGSGFVLPANPFGELESASLEHFIECTIYEERASTSEMFGVLDDSGERARGGDLVVPANPLASADDDDGETVSGVLGDDDEPAVVIDTPPPQVAIPAPAMAAVAPPIPRPVTVSPSMEVQIGDRTIPLLWLVGAAVAVVLIVGLILGYLIWGGGSASSETAPADPEPTAAAAVIAVDAAVAAAEIPDAAVALDAAVAPDRSIQSCSIEASAEPEGASVSLGGEKLGETPGRFEVPCGELAITLDHPRYKGETRTVTAVPGEPASLDGHLQRPRYRLRIRTRPAGASVTVGGRRVGTSPVTITVNGFERQRVMATKRGYRKASRRVYLKKSGGVTLNLKRNNARKRRRSRR